MKEIRILIDHDTQDVVVLVDGVERHLKGIMVFGGDAFAGEAFIFAHGCSADCAYAMAEAYRKPCAAGLFKAISLEMGRRIDPRLLLTEGDGEEIAARWEADDKGKTN